MEYYPPNQLLLKIRFSNDIFAHSQKSSLKPQYFFKNRPKILCSKPTSIEPYIENQHSQERPENSEKQLNWKKWSLNNEKYRLNCSWKKQREKEKVKSMKQMNMILFGVQGKIKRQMIKLKKVQSNIKQKKENDVLLRKLEKQKQNKINGFFDRIETQIKKINEKKRF